jgi:hypothetical protein
MKKVFILLMFFLFQISFLKSQTLSISDGSIIEPTIDSTRTSTSFQKVNNVTVSLVHNSLAATTSSLSTGSFNNLVIDHSTNNGNYTYSIYTKVYNDLTKAFAIVDQNGNDKFRIFGNGIVYAKKIYAEAFEVRYIFRTKLTPYSEAN